VLATATFTRSNGSTGTLGDVAFAFKPSALPQADNGNDEAPSDADAATAALSQTDTRLDAIRGALGFDFNAGDLGAQGQSQEAKESLEAVAASLDSSDAQMAQMIQAMASFGPLSGASELLKREMMLNAGLDWVTASAA
jgi:hypothetical protein